MRRTPSYNQGHVLDNGTVVLHEDEDFRRSIRPEAIDSITTDIEGGVATLHLRDGHEVDVKFPLGVNANDPYEQFNHFCWAVEALIDGGAS